MLTEVVRHARLLPEKTNDALTALWEQQLNERDARNRAQSQQKPKKAVKVAKEVPKDQWTKTERGWVAPGATATVTTASSSRGCVVM